MIISRCTCVASLGYGETKRGQLTYNNLDIRIKLKKLVHQSLQLLGEIQTTNDVNYEFAPVFTTLTCILYLAASISNVAFNFVTFLSIDVLDLTTSMFSFSCFSYVRFNTLLHGRIFSIRKIYKIDKPIQIIYNISDNTSKSSSIIHEYHIKITTYYYSKLIIIDLQRSPNNIF